MKEAGEPITMITAYDYPSATGRRGGRGRHRPGRRLGGDGRARLPGHRAGLDGRDDRPRQSRAPRPDDAADGRRHADGQLRGEQRARRLQRPAAGQGDRLPDGQAGGRGHLGRARPGDHQLRHPGDGPRRPDPADRDRAGRLQGPGQDRPGRDQALRGRPRPAVGRLLRDRLRGGPAAVTEAIVEQARGPDDRDRRRPGDLGPGARLPRPARDHDRPHGEIRQALRRRPRDDGRRRSATTSRRSARATSPNPTTSTASSRPSSTSCAATSTRRASPRQKAWDWEPLP